MFEQLRCRNCDKENMNNYIVEGYENDYGEPNIFCRECWDKMSNKEIKKYCKNCEFWERNKVNKIFDNFENMGLCDCNKFIDVSNFCSEDYKKIKTKNILTISDYEGFGAELYTGENFGCIHCEEKGFKNEV